MSANPILEELYRVRGEYAASFNFDIAAIRDDARAHQGDDGRKVVSVYPRRPKNWREPDEATEEAKL